MSALSLADLGLGRTLLRAVENKARRHGKTPPEYVRLLIERDILADRTFDEILRPIRQDVRKSGLTQVELDRIVERARNAVYRKSTGTRR